MSRTSRGVPSKNLSFVTRQDTGRILRRKQEKSYAELLGKLVSDARDHGVMDHFANVCKEDAKSNAVAPVEEMEESKAEFLSVKAGPPVRVNAIKQRDEISRIGKLDWDKELKHWVRRKPRGMA